MTVSLNGSGVMEVSLTELSIGTWTARVEVDAEDAITGLAVLDIDGALFNGFIRRGDVEGARFIAEMVGGAGGLSTELDAKFYQAASLTTILADFMLSTGEVLSPTVDPAITSTFAERFTRSSGRAGGALRQILESAPADVWRVLRDGTVWLGTDLFVPVSPAFEFTEIERMPDQGVIVIAPEDSPDVKPGDSFEGFNVSAVTTIATPDSLRQEIMTADPDEVTGFDRMLGPLQRFIEQLVGKRIDYSQMYPSKVIVQKPIDGSLDILPDDPRMRGLGLTSIPIRHGLPGVSVTVPPGGRVNLFFEDGDPRKPAVSLWPDGSSATKITIGADVEITGSLDVQGEVTAKSAVPAIAVGLSTHNHPTAPVGPVSPPTPGT